MYAFVSSSLKAGQNKAILPKLVFITNKMGLNFPLELQDIGLGHKNLFKKVVTLKLALKINDFLNKMK